MESRIFDIRDYGAKAEEGFLNTFAIQAAIDACNASGGGDVLVSGGIYMTGTVVMKSNVNLHIAASGTLFASPNCGKWSPNAEFDLRPYPYNVILSGEIEDYGDFPDIPKEHVDVKSLPRNRGCSLIFAENAENFSISGMGKIDSNGTAFTQLATKEEHHYTPYRRINAPTPPRVVFLTGCQNVRIEDISIVNSPAGWAYWIHDCDYVTFDKVKIICDLRYPNNDGIHINCSRNVTVSNASIICSDDCIIVRANSRSLKENKVCEKITVTNCNLTTPCAAVRIGFVNDGVIKNCVFSNLVITDTTVGVLAEFPDKELIQSDFGREATHIENLSFSNVIMDNVDCPLSIRIGNSAETTVDAVKHISFTGLNAKCVHLPVIKGREGSLIEDIRFSDCVFRTLGNESTMTAIFADGISLNNVRISKEK